MTKRLVYQITLLIAGLGLILELASRLVAEILWFQEVGYLEVLLLRLKTQGLAGVIPTAISAVFLMGNLALARHLQHPIEEAKSPISGGLFASVNLKKMGENYQMPAAKSLLAFPWLLLALLGLSAIAALMVIHLGQLAAGSLAGLSMAGGLSVPPIQLGWESIGLIVVQLFSDWWELSVVLGLMLAVTIKPDFGLRAIAIFVSLAIGIIIASRWTKVLQYFHPINFNATDPIFSQDISFYVFILPILELFSFSLTVVFLYGLVSCTFTYLLSGNSLSQGIFWGFSRSQQRHLYGLGAALMLATGFHYWLARYELLYSRGDVSYGANYADATVRLPLYGFFSFVAWAIPFGIASLHALLIISPIFQLKIKNKKFQKIIFSFSILICLLIFLLPQMVQQLIVKPNELAQEKRYIKNSIAFTQKGFNFKEIEIKTFDPEGKLTYSDLEKNQLTISNIRLWDKRPLLQTNRQLQQIRPYYKFLDADIDRYTVKNETGKMAESQSQQVILAARELDYTAVSPEAQTWVNEHLVYTHGYGFTLSPVNTVGVGGLPDYFVKDIGVDAGSGETALDITSDRIRVSIPIGHPRIYYGEVTDTDVMTPTKVKEFDYPSGKDNVYNIYNGKGGIAIGSIWKRWIFANYLKNWQMAITRNFTPETKLLYRRNIQKRVRAIAPFLRYDSDPYLVVANAHLGTGDLTEKEPSKTAQNTQSLPSVGKNSPNYLYWIFDAYTTSDRYPYSDPGKNEFNYIRNSVKVVIDAYNGSVNFYVVNSSDPIIKSWIAIFPRLFKPIEQMPPAIRKHMRYPMDLLKVQSERLLTYHMEDPQVFYNREDLWRVPNEIYGGEQQPVEPYYLITKLPTEKSEEFILLLPFTPVSRNNLIAWIAGRSDEGDYGKLLLYQFPKQRLVYGPEQIEALINQDPVISEQISLWNRQGSKAIQGNLLVIPIEQSLLYVEPLYLEADRNSLPTLVRVIVAYENRIVMAETLDEALKALFQKKSTNTGMGDRG
ncbi:MAG: UPF0182 family protein [Tychonema bourrellyi B0820]|uniref:UPF0182 protein CP500_013085 n=1 Tax=Tychonema bourrellyi FEM_GT703 TaxID=2040638 RepID=A0A2G4EZS4_9CYAN|nr:UPF0182 family protein [Tychonema bourrellyi]MDQ2098121.1 UPF0182 family protein [Tychonema bourrellyi B0820]PHX55010.1 hypothetical protein CP500_013085 [Tychonema bourrellyi FEM_GT703]